MKSILIADDSPTFLTLERTFLRDLAAEIHTARDGLEALRAAREKQPDLILLDVEMPNLGGLELLRMLRADAAFRHTPILLISTIRDPARVAEAKALGASDYLTKPINKPLLRARIGKYITA